MFPPGNRPTERTKTKRLAPLSISVNGAPRAWTPTATGGTSGSAGRKKKLLDEIAATPWTTPELVEVRWRVSG